MSEPTPNGPKIIHFQHESRFFSSASLNCDEPIIFHYTRAGGALGILQSGQMWCTLAYHMNDKQECKYAHEIVRSLAYNKLNGASSEHKAAFIKRLNESFEQIERVHIYVASFSEAEDLLSQWRGYSAPNGYNFGFSLNKLRGFASQQGFSIADVRYERQEQEAVFAGIVDAMLSKYFAEGGPDRDRIEIGNAIWPFITQIAQKSPLIKHPSFSEEREWRLFSNPFSDNYSRIDFIVRGDEIVPIYKFDLNCGMTEGKSPKRDIMVRSYSVGPGENVKERGNAISSVFQRTNTYWRVGGQSQAPLR